MTAPSCRLYLITPPQLDVPHFRDVLAAALDASDVATVQLRLKDVGDDEIRRAAEVLCPLTQARNVAFLMNDHPVLARETGCDGVHVGQQDTPFAEARCIVGPDAIVGVTCHASRDLAFEAADAGADYVAFGAFFPTRTKDAKSFADPDILAWWSGVTTVPCVAIGGIDARNCKPLVQAGADFLAVVSAVWSHPDGAAAGVRALNTAIADALAERPA